MSPDRPPSKKALNGCHAVCSYTDLEPLVYTCRMCINYDVSRPTAAVEQKHYRIRAKVLAVPCRQDALHPWEFITWVTDRINTLGGNAESSFWSDYGHMAGILRTDLFAEKVREFLDNNFTPYTVIVQKNRCRSHISLQRFFSSSITYYAIPRKISPMERRPSTSFQPISAFPSSFHILISWVPIRRPLA